MKHITELIQKQVVKKHSRALMFYLFLLIAATVLAWISQSLYVSLFIVAFLAALAVRLIQAVHALPAGRYDVLSRRPLDILV